VGGRYSNIRTALMEKFGPVDLKVQHGYLKAIDDHNTASACYFCNSATSRTRALKTIQQLITEATGEPDDVVAQVIAGIDAALERKKKHTQWKLGSIKRRFESEIIRRLSEKRLQKGANS
jgi:hypothetical protein